MNGYWLRPNDTARQPNSWVAFDCEARIQRDRRGETQTFRLAVGEWHHRTSNDTPWSPPVRKEFDAPGDLWRWIAGRSNLAQRVVVVAHNIAYDLRVTRALEELAALGWTAEPPMIQGGRVMFRFRKGRRRLVCVDSMNWWPWGLARVGEAIGLAKVDLPDDDDSDAAWWKRCHRDVDILATAWGTLLDWVQAEDLGTWKPTGAGQAMTAFRHQHLTHRILCHQDPPARAAEREAAWCGRAEAWRWGKLSGGPFTEWDMTTAYCRIMEECEVPTQLVRHTTSRRLWERSVAVSGQAGIARVVVTTEAPVVPWRAAEGVSWPVGTFETTLWDHELVLVDQTGGTWEFVEGWIYLCAPALQAFAEWCRQILEAHPGTVDEAVRLAVKHMTRAIVGKFGARYWEWVDWGPAPDQRLELSHGGDPEIPGSALTLWCGGRWLVQGPTVDSERSVPQVWSWIQAETRVRLWGLMTAAGLENVVYVDTDGAIVTPAGHEALVAAELGGVRPKSEYRDVEILGTRQLILDQRLKAAGIPKGAKPAGGNKWAADVWTQPATALLHGETDRVTIKRRTFRLVGGDHRRVRLAGGTTEATRI